MGDEWMRVDHIEQVVLAACMCAQAPIDFAIRRPALIENRSGSVCAAAGCGGSVAISTCIFSVCSVDREDSAWSWYSPLGRRRRADSGSGALNPE